MQVLLNSFSLKKEVLGWLGMKEEFNVKKEKISNALHMLWKSTGKLEVSMVMAENWKKKKAVLFVSRQNLSLELTV